MAKQKTGIEQLSAGRFLKLAADRLKFVSNASDAPVSDLKDHLQNQLAEALHPHVQFLTVGEVIVHSDDMKSYILRADPQKGTKQPAWFSAGQYLSIAVFIDGKMYCRPYSIASSPRDTLDGFYMITVKRVQGGVVSGYILDNWKVGSSAAASAPLGEFTYEPLRDAKTVIGIAGGSGITPFRSFAKAISEGDEDFNLVLLYGSRTLNDAVFSDEIAAMAKDCDKIKLVNVLSDEKVRGKENGFITAKLIKKYAPKEGDYSIFLCGPQAMYRFADKEIETLGLRRKFVRHELFGEYFHPENDAEYHGDAEKTYQVTVRMAGKATVIPCKGNTSLLRAMEDAGLNPPSDCRSGRCGWCHSQLLAGEVYTPASVDGRREADLIYGYIHPCCAFPETDVTIDVPPMPGL